MTEYRVDVGPNSGVVQLSGDLGVGVGDEPYVAIVIKNDDGRYYMYRSHPSGAFRTGWELIICAFKAWWKGIS